MTQDEITRLNKRDLIRGLRLLMAKEVHSSGTSQADLSSFSGVGEPQISKMLNIDDPYTPTIRTLSKILWTFNQMTLIEFVVFIKENTFKH
jgi:hypothetical protein